MLFVCILGLYVANGDILIGNDSKPNTFLAAKLLERGELTFTPEREPFMFHWVVRTTEGERAISIAQWNQDIGSYRAAQLRQNGRLRMDMPKYFLVRAVEPGHYVSFYGPGSAVAALPVYAIATAMRGSLSESHSTLWYVAKWTAALYTAGSVLLVFVTACSFLTKRQALILGIVYGAGTCIWSTSSQALWQHAPNEFFIALGFYFLHRVGETPRFGAYCGFALACAVFCRPTSAVVVLAVGLHLLLSNRRACWRFAAAGMPIALLLGAYNWSYLGSPFTFGQSLQGDFAQGFTGSADLWQTPLFTGLTGVLFSPSRGLFVYSPVLVFSVWGAWRCVRDPQYAFLRPAAIATAVTVVLISKYYAWWGGWSYGYRLLVDTAPLLSLLLIPVFADTLNKAALRHVAALALAWSIYVQVIGAFAYNVYGWNALGERDIDLPIHRERLWSVADSQIVYYSRNFKQARANKQKTIRVWIDRPDK